MYFETTSSFKKSYKLLSTWTCRVHR